MTLTEFLLARIAEDEAAATAALTRDHWRYEGCGDFGPYVSGAGVETEDSAEGQDVARYLERMNPWRVVAECEAKRQIVGWHIGPVPADYTSDPDECEHCRWAWPCHTMRALALPYADHPDYRDEWRP